MTETVLSVTLHR